MVMMVMMVMMMYEQPAHRYYVVVPRPGVESAASINYFTFMS